MYFCISLILIHYSIRYIIYMHGIHNILIYVHMHKYHLRFDVSRALRRCGSLMRQLPFCCTVLLAYNFQSISFL